MAKQTAMIKWDEELAKQAQVAAGMEASTGGSRFFSTKSGVLSFDGAPVPGNQMAVVILGAMLENAFYEGKFDADNPVPPVCYALGTDEKAMAPHADVQAAGNAMCERCADCPKNEWGSAEEGKGKGCKNTRRLSLIPAGDLDTQGRFTAYTDPAHFQDSPAAILRVPPTSLKGYGAFVRQIASGLRRPPHAIFTKVRLIPDQKTQFRLLFEALESVPNELIPVLIKRHEQAQKDLDFPYPEPEEAPAKPQKGKKAAPKAPAAGPRGFGAGPGAPKKASKY